MINLAYIDGKIVNTANILYINCEEDKETGKIHCLFVLSKDIVLKEVYENVEAFRRAFTEYGLMRKENTMDIILEAIERIFARLKNKFCKRKGRHLHIVK